MRGFDSRPCLRMEQANCLACVREVKAAAVCEFDPPWAGRGEHREAESREFVVRQITCDRFPPVPPSPRRIRQPAGAGGKCRGAEIGRQCWLKTN